MQPLAQDWFPRANHPSLDVLAGMVSSQALMDGLEVFLEQCAVYIR